MLFKFKLEPQDDLDIRYDDMIRFNDKLQAYGLFSFQHRLMNKILTFTHNIINNPNSPSEIKIILKLNNNIFEEEIRPEDFIRLRRNIKKNV